MNKLRLYFAFVFFLLGSQAFAHDSGAFHLHPIPAPWVVFLIVSAIGASILISVRLLADEFPRDGE